MQEKKKGKKNILNTRTDINEISNHSNHFHSVSLLFKASLCVAALDLIVNIGWLGNGGW